MKYLNLGCGDTYSRDWTNIDFFSNSEFVQAHNLLNGIPYSEESFDAVYHSHVLEHFSKADGTLFIRECFRVLKPGGIIRIVVPNLEEIARLYLDYLSKVKAGEEQYKAHYDWMMLELYDQTVRTSSGGEIGKLWASKPANEDFIISRHGQEYLGFRKYVEKTHIAPVHQKKSKLRNLFNLEAYKNKLLLWISGDNRLLEYVQVGRFRLGGEIHQWMYDEFSLSELLKSAGFSRVKRVSHNDSNIPNWSLYNFLDMTDGRPRKPDSLFMEAIK
jgi:predicted SAM-dependent methyltransferase